MFNTRGEYWLSCEHLIPSLFVSNSSRIGGERKKAGVRLSIAKITTGVINIALFWSEQMTQLKLAR
jgi:hypothetical protein